MGTFMQANRTANEHEMLDQQKTRKKRQKISRACTNDELSDVTLNEEAFYSFLTQQHTEDKRISDEDSNCSSNQNFPVKQYNQSKKTVSKSKNASKNTKKRKSAEKDNGSPPAKIRHLEKVDIENDLISCDQGLTGQEFSSQMLSGQVLSTSAQELSDQELSDQEMSGQELSDQEMPEMCILCNVEKATLRMIPCKHLVCYKCGKTAYWYPSQKFHQESHRSDTCPACNEMVLELDKHADCKAHKVFRRTFYNLNEICKFTTNNTEVILRPSKRTKAMILQRNVNNKDSQNTDIILQEKCTVAEFLSKDYECPDFWSNADFEDAKKFVYKMNAKHVLEDRTLKEMSCIFEPGAYKGDCLILYPKNVEKIKHQFAALSHAEKRATFFHPKRIMQLYRKNMNFNSFGIFHDALKQLNYGDEKKGCVVCTNQTTDDIQLPCCNSNICYECAKCFAKITHYTHRKSKNISECTQICPLCLDFCMGTSECIKSESHNLFKGIFEEAYVEFKSNVDALSQNGV